MNYADFKKELKENILAYSEIDQLKIVAHYDDKFQEKTADGIGETEIVESFGSITESIESATILLDIKKPEPEEEKKEEKKDSAAAKYAKDTATDFKKDVQSNAKSEVRKATNKASSNLVSGAVDFIGGLFKKK